MVEFTKEFQRFLSGCRLSYISGYVPLRNRSKRPPVLRDQKVLPEVRNRPLLPRENFKFGTVKKWLRIQYGNPPFHHFNVRYTYGSKLQFEKLLGGWCVVSCKSIQFPKFTVQAQGYAIKHVTVHKSDKSPTPNLLIERQLGLTGKPNRLGFFIGAVWLSGRDRVDKSAQ